MPAEQVVLTREYGIANYMTPTGRKLGIMPEEWNATLLKIAFVDERPGDLPDRLKGHYTKRVLAERVLDAYIQEFWDTSDEVSAKAARKQG